MIIGKNVGFELCSPNFYYKSFNFNNTRYTEYDKRIYQAGAMNAVAMKRDANHA